MHIELPRPHKAQARVQVDVVIDRQRGRTNLFGDVGNVTRLNRIDAHRSYKDHPLQDLTLFGFATITMSVVAMSFLLRLHRRMLPAEQG